jgi:hypothetical protein
MNPRIQELFIQKFGKRNFPKDNAEVLMSAEDLEKFAELIVEECARVARATPFPDTDVEVRKTFGHTWDMASIEAGREIVKHFGVEQ